MINNDTDRYSAVDQCDDRGRAMWTTYAHALSAAAGSQANHCECEPINITLSTITAIWSMVVVWAAYTTKAPTLAVYAHAGCSSC